MSKSALIFWGGWDGHTPREVALRFGRMLEEEGFSVKSVDSQDILADGEYLKSLDLIVPIWTMGEIPGEAVNNISLAVASGVGLAGNHGGMCDAFRNSTEWQFLTGGNWVAHPGGEIDYTVNIVKNSSSPIVEGIGDFAVHSEQYYLHYDPAVDVLATTRFPVFPYYHTANKPVDMPVIWTKKWGHGRVFYNSLGHVDAVFDAAPEAALLMRRGMLWAAAGKAVALSKSANPDEFLK